jgi:hypothetical protein
MVKSDDEELERSAIAPTSKNFKLSDAHLGLGVVAFCGRSDPQFQAFAERQLLAAIETGEGAVRATASAMLIWHYTQTGAIESVVAVHEHMLAHDPSPATHCEIGRLLRLRNPQRAEAAYRATLELSPQDRHATHELIRLLFRQQRIPEAEQLARSWGAQHPDDPAIAAVGSALRFLSDRSGESAVQFVSALKELDLSLMSIDDVLMPMTVMVGAIAASAALPIAEMFYQHASGLPKPEAREWFFHLAGTLSWSSDPAVVQLAMKCDAQAPSSLSDMHVKFALVAGGPDRALDVLEQLAAVPNSLNHMLDLHRDTLMELAAANPERLHEIISTIPLFEPLALALAQELGHDVLAPYEVSEVAKDIRAEIQRLRGPTYVVDVPVLAAAEDARPPRAKVAVARMPKTGVAKKATKKPARSTAASREGEAGKRKASRKRT